MPRRVKFDRESIIRAALDIVREGGPETLNARAVAARLGSSTQPLYSGLGSMDELRAQVYARAAALFNERMAECGAEGVPRYKACGLTLLRFANEERALYRLLFLSDIVRVANARACLEETAVRAYEAVMDITGYPLETARSFHRHMFIFTQGMASLIATGCVPYDEAYCSTMLDDEYTALRKFYDERQA